MSSINLSLQLFKSHSVFSVTAVEFKIFHYYKLLIAKLNADLS